MSKHYESLVPCPHCAKRNIQTVVSYNFARGLVLAVRTGQRRVVGCASCCAGELRKEAGRSVLYGWLSPAALVLTLINAPWNFCRSFFVRPNKERVVALFHEIGVPTSAAEGNPALSLHAAVAAMIQVDGKIDVNELKTARTAGPRYIDAFSDELLDAMIARPALSVKQIGALLKPHLSDSQKERLITLLYEVAHGDGDYDRREAVLLRRLCDAIGAPQHCYDKIGAPPPRRRDRAAPSAAPVGAE